MQGLKLTAPPLCCSEDLPPAQDQPSFPTSPPGPRYEVTEPEDTTGQAKRRATSSTTGNRVGPQVSCTELSSDAAASIPPLSHAATITVVCCLRCFVTIVLLCTRDCKRKRWNQHVWVCLFLALYVVNISFIFIVSRTQLWRYEKRKHQEAATAAGADIADLPPPPKKKYKSHKTHQCSTCHKVLSSKYGPTNSSISVHTFLVETGHSQYKGSWYCPDKETVSLTEWKELQINAWRNVAS